MGNETKSGAPTGGFRGKMEHYLYSGEKKHVFAGIVIISAVFAVPWYFMTRGAKHQSHQDYLEKADKARSERLSAASSSANLPTYSFFIGCLAGGLLLATLGDSSSLGRKNILLMLTLLMSASWIPHRRLIHQVGIVGLLSLPLIVYLTRGVIGLSIGFCGLLVMLVLEMRSGLDVRPQTRKCTRLSK